MTVGRDGWELNFMLKDGGGLSKGMGGVRMLQRTQC